MELHEGWVAAPADDELRRTFAETDLDDGAWSPISVPGHWRSCTDFADHDGPLFYRTRFEHPPGDPTRRWWLRFDGIFYEGDVWLDGSYVGDTEGYFFAHSFEVTDQLRARSEHVLAVEAGCDRGRDHHSRSQLTGHLAHGDDLDPAWNPGGLWRPVHLEDSGPVRIRHLVTRCIEATAERAVLAFTADLDAADAVDTHLRTTVGGIDHGTDRTLAAGDNTVEWTVTIDRPRRWWPHALGDAHLESVTVEVRLRDAAGSHVSDRRRFRTGLREVSMRRWILSVNGERMFCKGANLGPTRMALADASPAQVRADVEAARDAGLDLVRLRAHVGRTETYDAADELGMLIWQDMPLQGPHARSVRKQAVRQAREMVAALAHHPSVAIWCAHDAPEPTPRSETDAGTVRRALRQQLPSWNRTVLDRATARAIDHADGTRPTLRYSGVVPNAPLFESTDSHLFPGWHTDDVGDLDQLARTLPARVRFVSAFGAQAVPDSDEFIDTDAWPELDWDHLATRHGLQLGAMRARVPTEGHTYDSWRLATQEHQAEVVRHCIETLRRLKYRPTGGFALLGLADSHPGITWSVLDHRRRPKLAHAALVAACRSVIVAADPLPAVVSPGDSLALDVHVVSDRRLDLSGWVRAELTWKGGGHEWHFEGDVPADDCVRAGTIQFEVPDAPGPLDLRLRAQIGDDQPDNGYRSEIVPA